uniref:TF-B3 domain-containing protein n=1 Tax=Manihot esculenta TaxID=3983 RepID=A0A2C9UHC9_MANES
MASPSSSVQVLGGSESELLTFEDMELHNVDVNTQVTKFECLLMVAAVATVKWEEQKRNKAVEMDKLPRLLRGKPLKKQEVFLVEEKGFSNKAREFKGEKLLDVASKNYKEKDLHQWRFNIETEQELNQKKNEARNTTAPKRRALLENQERRKRHRKTSSKSENGDLKSSTPLPQPSLPEKFKKLILEMKGTEAKLQVLCEFLNEDEKEKLEKDEHLQVKIIDPNLEVSDMNFRQWKLNKPNGSHSLTYVFRTHWNEFKKNNGLKEDDIIQVWGFRVEGKILFALVKAEEG